MPYHSLREFLDRLEREKQLLRIEKEVLPEPDISAAACAASKIQGGPAILFERIQGYEGKKVVMNIHGSWKNHALMLEMPKDTGIKEQFQELVKRWDDFPIPPKEVSKAPLKEIIINKNINLFNEIPLFRVNRYDGGYYLSKACVVSKDPENTKNQNVGIYRLQVKDKDRIGIQMGAHHDIAVHLKKAEELNIPLRIAIAIGNEPVTSFVACTPLRYGEDEYSMMGAIRGVPTEVIKTERGDLDVPAGAEIIIEGKIIPRKRFVEGPFVEFTGYYSPSMIQAEIKVDLISRRKDPILFENLYTGIPWTEIDYLQALNTSVSIYKQMKPDFPEINAVNAMYSHGFCTIISTRLRYGGFGKMVACKLLSTPHGLLYPKIIILVDEDIDPFNLEQVIWAMTVRFRPERDIFIIPNAPGSTADPSATQRGLITRMIIDSTEPVFPDIEPASISIVKPPTSVNFWMGEIHKKMKE